MFTHLNTLAFSFHFQGIHVLMDFVYKPLDAISCPNPADFMSRVDGFHGAISKPFGFYFQTLCISFPNLLGFNISSVIHLLTIFLLCTAFPC